VARAAGKQASTVWQVGLCSDCALLDLDEERRRMVRVAPWKGLLLTVFAILTAAASLIALSEPGWWKLWSLAFAVLFLRCVVGGPGLLLALPMMLRRLSDTRSRLIGGEVETGDEDLLVNLEASRALQALRTGGWDVRGGLVLPEVSAASAGSVRYEVRRGDGDGQA
jgi:hypothetical protein